MSRQLPPNLLLLFFFFNKHQLVELLSVYHILQVLGEIIFTLSHYYYHESLLCLVTSGPTSRDSLLYSSRTCIIFMYWTIWKSWFHADKVFDNNHQFVTSTYGKGGVSLFSNIFEKLAHILRSKWRQVPKFNSTKFYNVSMIIYFSKPRGFQIHDQHQN